MQDAFLTPAPVLSAASRLVDAIGTVSFEANLLAFLHGVCGADHCAVYRLGKEGLAEVGTASLDGSGLARQRSESYLRHQFWRRDPALPHVTAIRPGAQPILLHMTIQSLPDAEFRRVLYPRINDRLFLAAQVRERGYTMSVLKSEACGHFRDGQVQALGNWAEVLLALLAKHDEHEHLRYSAATALEDVVAIERVFARRLPRREAQVCARILRGLSTTGIALDLGIGAESVKTYRKTAYQRLALGSQRELLGWYLARTAAAPYPDA